MKIIIELQDNYANWPKKRINKLQKWLNELTVLLVDGQFMQYAKTVTFEEKEKTNEQK